MIWGIGIISVCGFATGIYSFMKSSKVTGVVELLLAIICPVIAILFGSLQNGRAFGGTKWEFFVHSATVDVDVWPWILLVLLIAEIVCIVRTLSVGGADENKKSHGYYSNRSNSRGFTKICSC